MGAILRCVSGLIRRCSTSGRILRCGGYLQWQTTYSSTGCGTCADGVFPGVWVEGTSELTSLVNEADAGTVVIDADLGTAVSYGVVYSVGSEPAAPDTSSPLVAPQPCACGQVYYVYCRTAYSSVQSCAPGFYSGGNVDTIGTDDICYTDEGGCSYDESPPYWVCDGCTWINAIPATGRCNKRIAGPFCTEAEGNTWITNNCGGGGVLDEYYTCCNASAVAQDPRCP